MKSKKQTPSAPDFNSWLTDASSKTNTGRAQSDLWPVEAIAEITEVLKRNDAGTASVTMSAMATRIRQKYGVVATRNGFSNYVSKLGRKGWQEK